MQKGAPMILAVVLLAAEIVPPAVAHCFSKVDTDMNHLVVRVDGDHILPAGYVHPAVGTP